MSNNVTNSTGDPAAETFDFSRVWDEPCETVELTIPAKALWQLQRIATHRGKDCQSLLQEYVGRGIREDASRLFSERALDVTREVLRKTLSPEAVEQVMQQIQEEFAVPRSLLPHR